MAVHCHAPADPGSAERLLWPAGLTPGTEAFLSLLMAGSESGIGQVSLECVPISRNILSSGPFELV